MRWHNGLPLFLCFAGALAGQTAVEVYRAEMSVSFGAVPGKLVLHPQTLTFVDDERPGASFSITRENVKNYSEEKGTLVLQLGSSVRDRSGEVARVSFRLTPETDSAAVTKWFREKPSGAAAVATGVADMSFDAKQDKMFGGSRGKLLATPTQLIYEAVDNASSSRRFEYKDIKRFKRPNPYKVEIEPFSGSKCELDLLGTPMDNAQLSTLTDRIANARANR